MPVFFKELSLVKLWPACGAAGMPPAKKRLGMTQKERSKGIIISSFKIGVLRMEM